MSTRISLFSEFATVNIWCGDDSSTVWISSENQTVSIDFDRSHRAKLMRALQQADERDQATGRKNDKLP